MRKRGNFDGGGLQTERNVQEFQNKKTGESKTKGVVFQGWKRYEEAEEEE